VVEVVGILVAAGDGEHAGAQNIGDAMCHQQRIAPVGDQRRKFGGDPHRRFDGSKQHHATIGRDAATIECGSDFLALHRW